MFAVLFSFLTSVVVKFLWKQSKPQLTPEFLMPSTVYHAFTTSSLTP